jgi:micrococcal nuclease
MVLDQRVELVPGAADDADRYGRLLRFVDVGGIDAGLRLIEDGWAVARYDSRDGYGAHPREERYIAADLASEDLGCYQVDEP